MFKNYKEFINENIQPFSIKNLEAIEDMLVTLDKENIDLAITIFNQRKDIKGSKEVNDKITEIKKMVNLISNKKNEDIMYELIESGIQIDLSSKEISKNITPIIKLIKKNCKRLGLDYNNISFLPKEIGKLTNLIWLHIENNKLKKLPKEIENLTNLTELTLNDNQLREFPKEIYKLVNLDYLSLENNQLPSISKEIGNLIKLDTLDLQNNQLKDLPKEIEKLVKMEYLFLGRNKLVSVPEEIGSLTELKTLYLNNNNLTFLPDSIGKLTNLKELYLYNNKFSETEKKIIQSYLPDLHIKF